MNLKFSLFSKLLASPPLQALSGLLAIAFLLLQAYNSTAVIDGSQLLVLSIFGQSQLLPWWICFLFGIACIVASLLVMLRINANHRFVDRSSYPFTVFLFIGLTSLPEFLLHPELLFTTFLGILVIYLLLEIYNQPSISGIIFKSAIICSFASLFYLPSIFLLLLILVSISIFRPFTLRNFLLVLIGFGLLYFYLYSLSYIFNWSLNFPDELNLQDGEFITNLFQKNNLGLLGMFVLALVSMANVFSMRQKLIVRQRNQLAVIFIAWLIYFGISLFSSFSDTLLMLLSLSSIFFLFFYHSIKKQWILDSLLIIIFIYNSFVSIFS